MCLICSEKLENNKKSNVERHFQNKHLSFAQQYSNGDARKKAVLELMRNADRSKQQFSKWIKSANSTTYASFVAAQEIVKHGKPFTDGEYLKNSFIRYLNIYSRTLKTRVKSCKKSVTCHSLQKLLKIEPPEWQMTSPNSKLKI